MYSETKIEKLSIVTRGPLKAELFGVPAGEYITYVRRRRNGVYGEPLEEYPVKADKYARSAWARHFETVERVREDVENGTKIHCPAVEEDPVQPPRDPVENVLGGLSGVTETIYGISLDNIARLIDKTGILKKLLDSLRAEGVSNETLFNAMRTFIHNQN